MLRNILIFGTSAGLIVAAEMFALTATNQYSHGAWGMAVGYLSMLIALSAVFAGIKRRRDIDLGGVIRFWPAFAQGLGISLIAGLFYVAAWEITQAAAGMDFARDYSAAVLADAKRHGASAARMAALSTQMADFRAQYADPTFRLPMTFSEIFPVGVLVSLISAGLLRKPGFLPARAR